MRHEHYWNKLLETKKIVVFKIARIPIEIMFQPISFVKLSSISICNFYSTKLPVQEYE